MTGGILRSRTLPAYVKNAPFFSFPSTEIEFRAGLGGSRLEAEAGLFGGPLDRRVGFEERTLEALASVMDLRRRDDTVPFHIERDSCPRRKDGWDLGIGEAQVAGKPQPVRQ